MGKDLIGKKIVAFLIALLLCVSASSLDAFVTKAATIRYSGTDGNLNWSIDSEGHLLVEGTGDYIGEHPGWYSHCNRIYSAKIVVDNVTNLSRYFDGCFSLKSIEWVELDTSKVTNMSCMFGGCGSLSELDLGKFNTTQVTDMSGMFSGCGSLTELDLDKFNTTQVTDMSGMFESCASLTSLDLSGFETSKVTNMASMFSGCRLLTELDLDKFNTTQVTDMSGMFSGCSLLSNLDLSGFETSKVTNMACLFDGCSNLTHLDLSGLKTANVTDMTAMFDCCYSLTNLELTSLDTSSVTSMLLMFGGCSSLTGVDFSNFNTSNVTNMFGMFSDCSNLTSLDVSHFDTSNVQRMDRMFYGCSELRRLNLGGFDMSQIKSVDQTFSGCNKLLKLDTPIGVNLDIDLPTSEVGQWTSRDGQIYTILPKNTNASMTLSCGKEKSEDLTGYTISLKGDIAVNLYMQLSDEIINDTSAYMKFTYADGEILNISVNKADTKGDSYVFTCNVQAPEMNDKFTAQIITSVCETEKYTYSVEEYADYILSHTESNNEYAKAAPMVRAMLNYGGYSQLQFKHNTDALANEGLYTANTDPVLIQDITIGNSYSFVAPKTDIGLQYYGSSLLLDAETTIRHYFTITSNDDIDEICKDYSFVLDDDTILTPIMRGGMIYIDIIGIKVAELDDMFTLVVKNLKTEATISVTYSPFSYAKYVLDNAIAGTKLMNVIKAMYLYNEAANNYFVSNPNDVIKYNGAVALTNKNS